MKTFNEIDDLMKQFNITNISFTSFVDQRGEAILRVKENVYRFTFNLFSANRIKEMIDQRTKEYTSFEQILNRIFVGLSKVEREKTIYEMMKHSYFKELLFNKLTKEVINENIRRLNNEADIKTMNISFTDNSVIGTCIVTLFEKQFVFNLIKKENITLIEDIGEERIEECNIWLLKEIGERSVNKEKFIFTENKENWRSYSFFGARDIIVGLAIEKIKESKQIKLLSLYNPDIKKILA
jgi:hypothetical protein